MSKQLDLEIVQGDTFTRIVRWETAPFVYKAISAITQSAPVSITATGHGLKNGWRAAVVSAQGMKEINAELSASNLPKDSAYQQVTFVDANTVQFNKINSAGFDVYTSGGYLQFYTPVDMAGYTARLTIKDRVGGTIRIALVSPTDIAIDNTEHTITMTIAAAITAAFTWTKGTYDLEMVSPTGVVVKLFHGSIAITKEVTT
jgi:hypothetical protein